MADVQYLSHHTDGSVAGLDQAPPLKHFDQRELFRGREDQVGLRFRFTRDGQPFFPDTAELAILNRFGFGLLPERVVDIVVRGKQYQFVNQDQMHLIEPGAPVELFSGTMPNQRWVLQVMGLVPDTPPLAEVRRLNDKGVFQKVFGETVFRNGCLERLPGIEGSMVPPGGCATRDSLAAVFEEMCAGNPAPRFLGKPPDAASGIGHTIFERELYGHNLQWQFGQVGARRVIFQQMLEGKDVDFSIEVVVPQGATPETLRPGMLCGQHIAGTSSHEGNFFPVSLPELMGLRARVSARIITEEIVRMGVTGFTGSIDYVGNTQIGEAMAVEFNLRQVAPDYVRTPIRERFGRDLPFDMRSFAIPKGLPIERVETVFEGLFFSQPGRYTGFLPFCFLPELPGLEEGISYGVCYAENPEDLAELSTEVERRKALLWE